jgi:YVTN family beta-propeller protein
VIEVAPRRFALLVATYDYLDEGLRQLVSPAEDAEALGRILEDPEIAGFEVTSLVNERHHVVGEAIGDFFHDRRRDDLALLYFTGHGVKDDDGRLYLAMTDTGRERLLFTGISADQINHAMDSCRSRQKILILDCCYSGAFPDGTRSKGDTEVNTVERFQGRGRAVLTASDRTQYSFERNQIVGEGTRSVFTHYLVEGLETGKADLDGDGDITLEELYSYVHDRVIDEMPQQRPKIQENVEGRIVVARNIHWVLPAYITNALHSPIASDRLVGINGLAHLIRTGNDTVRASVIAECRQLADDDSRTVSAAAASLLESEPSVEEGSAAKHPTPDVERPSFPDVELPSAPDAHLTESEERQPKGIENLPSHSADANTGASGEGDEPVPIIADPRNQGPNKGRRPRLSHRRRRLTALLAAFVAIAALILGLLYWWPSSTQQGLPPQSSSPSPPTSPPPSSPPSSTQPYKSDPHPKVIGQPIQVGENPEDVVVAPDGKSAYVTNEGKNTVSVINVQKQAVVKTITIPGPLHPQFVAFTPRSGRYAYVSLKSDDKSRKGAVAIIDTTTYTVLPFIPVGRAPYALNFTPDGAKLYVPDHDDSTITVIDTSTNTVIHHIRIAPDPHCIVFSKLQPRAYIANHATNRVTVMDTTTDKVVHTILNVGTAPHSLALSPNEKEIYVANFGGSNVSIINVATNAVVKSVPVGYKPQAVAFAPDGNHAYVANSGGVTVTVIDTRSRTRTDTVTVGNSPTSVSFLPDGSLAYVTNNLSDTVSVLSAGSER